jgi:uncharacterized protein YcgI (DUF1989 family)
MVVPTSDAPTTIDIQAQSGAVVKVSPGHRLRIIDVE